MTKLKYDADYLKKYVKSSLESSNRTLKTAANAANMSVPNDFRYYSYMNGLSDKLSSCSSRLDSCDNWLVKSMATIEQSLEELQSDVEGLEEPIVKEKEKSVITI